MFVCLGLGFCFFVSEFLGFRVCRVIVFFGCLRFYVFWVQVFKGLGSFKARDFEGFY